jgi:hypothetical protein
MEVFELQQNKVKYVYRVGKRKADYSEWLNGIPFSFQVKITSLQAEKDMKFLKAGGFSCKLIKHGNKKCLG